MAGRFGRSLYRFSSVNRPAAPGGNTSTQDSAQYDRQRYPSANKETFVEPRSPPLSPKRGSLPVSPTYSLNKIASPPSSPSYMASTARVVPSPLKPVDEHLNQKPTVQPRSPIAEPKSMVYKAIEKVMKPDRHVESGKTTASSHKQQPNAINIAGENIGAVMEIVESKQQGEHSIKKDKKTEDKSKGKKALNAVPASTFLNTNFQTVNNSLIFNASLADRDPGLHLAFSRNPTGDRSTVDDKKKQHNNYQTMKKRN